MMSGESAITMMKERGKKDIKDKTSARLAKASKKKVRVHFTALETLRSKRMIKLCLLIRYFLSLFSRQTCYLVLLYN
jgi:hypothetical protein